MRAGISCGVRARANVCAIEKRGEEKERGRERRRRARGIFDIFRTNRILDVCDHRNVGILCHVVVSMDSTLTFDTRTCMRTLRFFEMKTRNEAEEEETPRRPLTLTLRPLSWGVRSSRVPAQTT